MSDSSQPLHLPEADSSAVSERDVHSEPLASAADQASAGMSEITNAELVLLRVRVIALEHVLIAVMSEGSDRQRQAVLDMADTITPKTDSTQHSLTIRAAQHMTSLVDRALHARAAVRKADI